MANEPTDEDRANAKAVLRASEGWHDDMVDDIAAALAAERARTIEACAKWHEERAKQHNDHAKTFEGRYGMADVAARWFDCADTHKDSAAAIRALGREGK